MQYLHFSSPGQIRLTVDVSSSEQVTVHGRYIMLAPCLQLSSQVPMI